MNKNPAMASDNNQPFGQCRCCLDFGYHKDISQPYYRNGVRIIYREVFLNTLNFRLSKNKYLSNMICKGCIRKLNNAMDFRELVVATERQLLARIGCYPVGVNIPVSQHKTSSAEEKINDTIIKKEEDDGWSNDGGDIDVQDDFEEQDVSSGPSTSTQALINNMSPCVVKLEKLNEEIEKDVEQDDTSKERNVNTQSATPANVPTRTEMHIADIVEATCSLMHDMTEKIKEKDVKLPTKKLHDLTEKIKEKDVRPPTKKIDKNTGPAKRLTTITTAHEDVKPSVTVNDELRPDESSNCKKTNIKHRTNNTKKPRKKQALEISSKTGSGRSLVNSTQVKRIKKTITPEKTQYICDKCAYTTDTRPTFLIHLKTHRIIKRYPCNICNANFASPSSLLIHGRKHTGEKPYSCEVCGRSFRQFGVLERHIRVHTGEKPYACTKCDKKFAQSGTLKSHIRIHTGEKPYACEMCDAKFAQKQNLICHVRAHTGDKPHACKICDKRFVSSSDVTKHMRSHTGAMRYTCTICNEILSNSTDLRIHLETHT